MPTNKGPHVGFYVNIATPTPPKDERGRLAIAQKELYARNRELALNMQQQVAQVIDRKILRQSVKSGRLVTATLDPKNRTYGRDHVGVGNEAFLDRSIAKYWRTIEEGSAATWTKRSFLSLELQGIWGMNVREGQWQRSAAGNQWSSLGGASEKSGDRRQEMYQPLRRGRHGMPSGLPVFHPGREIQPMRAYEYVARNPQYTRAALRAGEEFTQRIMDSGITPARNFDWAG